MSHSYTCMVNNADDEEPPDLCGDPAYWEMGGQPMCSDCFYDILACFQINESAFVVALGAPDAEPHAHTLPPI